MDHRKIREFVTFVPGINPTRSKKQFGTEKINYYDQAAFERDYSHDEGFIDLNRCESFEEDISLKAGDVVISNSMQLATVVGNVNSGKVPSLNFTKVDFINNELDARYFTYLFNTYSEVKRQKVRELQGMGPVLRIPIKALNEIVIPIISMEEQIRIGKIYCEMLKLQSSLNKYTELIEKFVGSILEENLKERKRYE